MNLRFSKQLLVATAKGLISYDMDSFVPDKFRIHFKGFSVNMIYVDERTEHWWAGVSHKHWGQKLHFSADQGRSWSEVSVPKYDGEHLPNGRPARLRQIWCMQHGGTDRTGKLWLGTDPGGLFVSEDKGEHFQLVQSLWHHPSRKEKGQWFGAGSDFPFIHSIVLDPRNSDHIYVAVSCAGVFKSEDGGQTWHPKNKGLKAAYLPNPNVEVGHDPHVLLVSPKEPDVLWQQNHCGIFVSKNGGEEWLDVSVEGGIPNYGFAMAMDESDPARAWVIPVESDENRIAPDLRLRVFETSDFGQTWGSVSSGLPATHVFDIVLRQAFAKVGTHMAFGTTNGNLYYSPDKAATWQWVTSHLTKVNSITFA